MPGPIPPRTAANPQPAVAAPPETAPTPAAQPTPAAAAPVAAAEAEVAAPRVRKNRPAADGTFPRGGAAKGPPVDARHAALASTPAPRNDGLADVRAGRTLLNRGDNSPQVETLQRRLNAAGANPPLATDGDFGPKTESAVRDFQRRNGLTADGVVGPNTMRKLDEGGQTPAPPAGPDGPDGPGVTPPVTTDPAGTTPHANVPARSMTQAQARQELEALRAQGVQFTTAANGRVSLQMPIQGVDFRYAGNPVGSPDRSTFGLDPRMAVATVRLAQWAKTQGTTEIVHRGFAGGPTSDRHNAGLALDVAGFRGRDPTTGRAFDHDVLRDWGNLPRVPGQNSRLDPNTASGKFFQDAYSFFTTQFRDRSGAGGPSVPGDRGGTYIISPDHRDPGLARDHADHFHVEIQP